MAKAPRKGMKAYVLIETAPGKTKSVKHALGRLKGGASTMGIPSSLVGCSNNVMVWLGQGPYPAPLPACFTVTTDRSVWDAAVATWKLRHGVVP